jgi:hypothetical protein
MIRTERSFNTMPSFESVIDSIDISTRPKRRKAVSMIIPFVSNIYQQEFEYLGRIPQNMRSGGAYAAADYSLDMLGEAMSFLIAAYDI